MMQRINLGKTGIHVTPVGYGAFKIGRNQKIKYPNGFRLPDETEATRILEHVLSLGINLIDTAPAYGLSEERIGRALHGRRDEFILSSKTGENFEEGESGYDYSAAGTEASVERSLRRLQTDVLDLVFVHSNGRDLFIQQQTDVVPTLQRLKEKGMIRAIGFSGKKTSGAEYALQWADAIMVEYHIGNISNTSVIEKARQQNVGVIVKKGLASGHLAAPEAIRFVLGNPLVHSLVIGGNNTEHLSANCQVAESLFGQQAA